MHKHDKKTEHAASAEGAASTVAPSTSAPAAPEAGVVADQAVPGAQPATGAVPVEPVSATATQESGSRGADAGKSATPPPPDAKHGGHHAHAESRKEAEARKDREIKDLNDKYLRLRADFDNFRKRTQRDQAEVFLRANQDLMQELLPALDHMDLALQAAVTHDATASFAKGFQMVADQLRAVLGKFGLQPFDAAGQVFDPSQHEAVSVLPSAETPANTVMAQARRGYRLGDRLLRPAQVVVSGGSPGAQSATADGPATAPAQGK